MTYNKPTKSIKVNTLGGSEFTTSDTATQPMASDALASFKAEKTMHIKGEKMNLVPFHATNIVEVIKSVMSAEKGDPYGCSSVVGVAKVCYAKVCNATVGC